jgi:hypothetical protein
MKLSGVHASPLALLCIDYGLMCTFTPPATGQWHVEWFTGVPFCSQRFVRVVVQGVWLCECVSVTAVHTPLIAAPAVCHTAAHAHLSYQIIHALDDEACQT